MSRRTRWLIATEIGLVATAIGTCGWLVWEGHHRAALAPAVPLLAHGAVRAMVRREAKQLESLAIETFLRRLSMQTQLAQFVSTELNALVNKKLPADLQPSVNALIVAAVTAAEAAIQKYGAQLLAKVLPATPAAK